MALFHFFRKTIARYWQVRLLAISQYYPNYRVAVPFHHMWIHSGR